MKLLLAALALALATKVGTDGRPEIGKPAPPIDGEHWLNHLGADPDLASLRGQAVLVEFWATW